VSSTFPFVTAYNAYMLDATSNGAWHQHLASFLPEDSISRPKDPDIDPYPEVLSASGSSEDDDVDDDEDDDDERSNSPASTPDTLNSADQSGSDPDDGDRFEELPVPAPMTTLLPLKQHNRAVKERKEALDYNEHASKSTNKRPAKRRKTNTKNVKKKPKSDSVVDTSLDIISNLSEHVVTIRQTMTLEHKVSHYFLEYIYILSGTHYISFLTDSFTSGGQHL
jgi:hypothetical protein